MKATGYNWRLVLPWLYNCAFPVVTIEEKNGLGSVSPMVSFETNPYLLSAIKTFCRERRKDGAEVSKINFNPSSSFLSFPFA